MRPTPHIFASILLLAFAATVASRYYHYVNQRDFLLKANTACDPAVHACFIMACEAGDADCDPGPYEKVEVLAQDAPACLEEHRCQAFSCDARPGCAIHYCALDNLAAGETCTTPKAASP